MNKRVLLTAVLLSLLSTVSFLSTTYANEPAAPKGEKATAAEKLPGDKATIPAIGDVEAEARYMWQLFVLSLRPGAGGSLTFEGWPEQCQLNPAMAGCSTAALKAGQTRSFHSSALARAFRKNQGKTEATDSGIECSPMQTTALAGYPPPTNLSKSPVFCEEVFVNNDEAEFVKAKGLTTLNGQLAYAKGSGGGVITFPKTSLEIKADWVPTSSFSSPTFQCPDPTNKLYTETINGTCYALVGLHISSKALPDWIWATFEPASTVTNPNRCDPKLYSTCFDPWGTTSKTPYGKGTTVPQSPQLVSLMNAYGLNKAFGNYYLTGAQTQFVNAQGKAIPLGSSFVEFNAGVLPGQASCITCHKYAYFDGKPQSPENNFGGPPNGWPAIGYACNTSQKANCTPLVPGSISQDFSWMLGLMPVK